MACYGVNFLTYRRSTPDAHSKKGLWHAELEVSEMLTLNIWASLHSVDDWVASINQGVYWVGCTSSYGGFGDRVNSCNTIAADAGLSCGASQIVPCVHLAAYLGLKFSRICPSVIRVWISVETTHIHTLWLPTHRQISGATFNFRCSNVKRSTAMLFAEV
jgi:hypothetical protein